MTHSTQRQKSSGDGAHEQRRHTCFDVSVTLCRDTVPVKRSVARMVGPASGLIGVGAYAPGTRNGTADTGDDCIKWHGATGGNMMCSATVRQGIGMVAAAMGARCAPIRPHRRLAPGTALAAPDAATFTVVGTSVTMLECGEC